MGVASSENLFYSIVKEISGDEGAQLATHLSDTQEITDEQLGEITGYKINIVRKILYKLYENHLASYRRIRDKDTGWFVYFWKLNPEKVSALTKAKKKKLLEELNNRLMFEQSHVFYTCINDECPRYTFEEAVETSFHCPRCQSNLQHFDNKRIIDNLVEQIRLIKSQL
ncbi:MAG: transcription factor E [Candidatus Ranarchaeia archaeon]